jgi:uncharacterized repeat protein (TIGR01451 family)
MSAGRARREAERRFRRIGGSVAAGLAIAIAGVALSGGTGAAAPPGGSADVSVTKSDSADPVSAGGALTYTLSVHNAGPDQATGVVVTDKLPNGVTFVSASATGGGTCSKSNLTVTCNIGTLGTTGGAASAQVTINVTAPNTARDITDTATVRADQRDPKQKNNRDTETTKVTGGPTQRPTCNGHPATFVGGPGSDTFTGGSGRDVVVTRGGDDVIATDGGRDIVCAGAGNDIVRAGGRADFVKGGRGADKIRGGGGDDSLHGGRGPDRLRGGPGDDLLAGGPGDDTCKGGPGQDTKRSC